MKGGVMAVINKPGSAGRRAAIAALAGRRPGGCLGVAAARGPAPGDEGRLRLHGHEARCRATTPW